MDNDPGKKRRSRGRSPAGPADSTEGAGYGFLGLAIGLANTALYALLPVLLFMSIWIMVSVYAIVKWAGSAPDQPNPVVLVVGVASLVMLFVVLIAIGVGLMGRAMNPKKRAG